MENKKLNLNKPLLSVRRYSQKVDRRKINNAIPQLPSFKSELKSGPVGNPGAVPFQWEQTPGQPKEEIKPQTQNCGRPPIAPKPPPGRYPKAKKHDSRQVSPIASDSRMTNFEGSKESREESMSSDSGDCDEAFADALNKLSRAQSFFLNSNPSGLTGMSDLDTNIFGLLAEPQSQEVLKDRFHPEAMAIASDTPQHTPEKQSLSREQLQQLERTVIEDIPAKRHSHCHNHEEDQERDDDYDHRGNLPAVCGLLPRLCLKSSVCLLNPVPAVSMRTQLLRSPCNRIQPRCSSNGSYTKTEDEFECDTIELKQVGIIEKAELKGKNSLENLISQLENTLLTNPDAPSSFVEEKGLLGNSEKTKHTETRGFGLPRKGFKTFRELLADQDEPNESDSGGSVVEKTVYVDTVQVVGNMKFHPSNTESSATRMDQDSMKLNATDDEAKLLPNANKSGDLNIVSSVDRKWGMETPKAFRKNQDLGLDLANIEVDQKEANAKTEKQLPRTVTHANSHVKSSDFPVPPPLPKSPSDSWLWRTLPSMPAKNSSRSSYLGATANPQRQSLCYSEELLRPIPET